MDVFSPSAVPVGILWWNGPTRRLTVIAKMTLVPRGAALVLADEQEPLRLESPSTLGVAGELQHPGDFIPFKPRCDVLLTGSAYASTPQSVIPVYFRVGTVERRVYALAGQPSNAIPLSSMYLRREANHGAEEVAVGPLSLQHAHRACFVDSRVPAQASLFENTALPPHFDGRCFNAAPHEQQIDPIAPGTPIILPWRGSESQTYWIPPMVPRIFLFDHTNDTGLREVAMTCDTMWIDTDQARCVLTFRGQIDPMYDGTFPTALVAVFASIYDAVLAGAATMICAQATIRPATKPRALEGFVAEPVVAPQSTKTPSIARSVPSHNDEATNIFTNPIAAAPAVPFVSPSRRPLTMLPDVTPRGAPVLPFGGAASALAVMPGSRLVPVDQRAEPIPQSASALPFVQAQRVDESVPGQTSARTSRRPHTLLTTAVTTATTALPFVSAPRPLDAWSNSQVVAATSAPGSALPFVSNEPRKRPSTLPPVAEIVSTEYDRPSPPSVPPSQALPFVSTEYNRPSVPSVPPLQALPFVSTEYDRPSVPPSQALPFVSKDFASSPPGHFHAPPLGESSFPVLRSAETPTVVEPSTTLDTSALMRISLDTFAEIKVDLWTGVRLRDALAKHGIDQRSYHLHERRQTDELGEDVRQGALDRTRELRAALRRARERRASISTDDGIL